jgi:hypothetical protein
MNKGKNGKEARFEFRVFGHGFGREIDEIRRLSFCSVIEEVQDTYLVTSATESNNIKIRGQSLSVKKLISVEQELELWRPSLKLDFPIAASAINKKIFKVLAVPVPLLNGEEFNTDTFNTDTFIMSVVRPHPEVRVAEVFKRRFLFQVERCKVEIDELLVNGAAIQSLAIESEEAADVFRIRQLLDMQRYENVSYPVVLKRIMGIVPLPPQRWKIG